MFYSLTGMISVSAALFLAWILYGPVYNIFFHPLRSIPGPIIWRAFDLPFIRSKLRGNAHKDILRLHQQYGPVVRLAPNEVSHTSAAVWREVWGHNKDPEFGKAVKSIPYNGVDGILSANRADHRRFRHLLSHSFSSAEMGIQEARIQHYIDLLMTQLSKQSLEGPQDMTTWYNWTSFDIISDLSFGESFGCLEHVRTHEWVRSLFGLVQGVNYSTTAETYGILPLLIYILPKRVRDARKLAYDYYHEKIARRVQYGKDRGDFLDAILQHPVLTEEEARHTPPSLRKGMTIRELESNASNLVLAGSETTATLLAGATFHLLRNPQVLEKLQSQIRQTFTSADAITMTTATMEVPYLLNVLNETLRIYNPVPIIFGRVVPPFPGGGATIADRFHPSGTRINFSPYCAYRMASNFARPLDFVPERWQTPRPAEFEADNPDGVFQPFSAGPRNCIGRNLAYAEMRVVLAKLLWWFDLAVPNKGEKGGDSWERWEDEQKCYTLWEKGPLWVDAKRRKDVAA